MTRFALVLLGATLATSVAAQINLSRGMLAGMSLRPVEGFVTHQGTTEGSSFNVSTGTDHYEDYLGRWWRQKSDGTWQRRIAGRSYGEGDFATSTPDQWLADDPNWELPYSTAPYRSYLYNIAQRFPEGQWSIVNEGEGWRSVDVPQPVTSDPRFIKEITSLGYDGHTYPTNRNPYASLRNADALRAFARALGLTDADADEMALAVAQEYFSANGQPYSEATSPLIIGNSIALKLAAKAGGGELSGEIEKASRIGGRCRRRLAEHQRRFRSTLRTVGDSR